MITYKRGLGKHNSDTRVYDLYKFYLKNRISDKCIPQKLFTDILGEYNTHKINQVIFRNIPYQIPYLGRLIIVKSKPRLKVVDGKLKVKYPIDYKKTKELWAANPKAKEQKRLVYHLNERSDHYVMKWKWEKTAIFENKSAYKFLPQRTVKRKISEGLKITNYNIDFFLDKKVQNVKD